MRFYVKEIFSVWSTVTRRSAVVYHQINHENLTGSSNEKNRKGKHSLAFILFFFLVFFFWQQSFIDDEKRQYYNTNTENGKQ